MAKVKFTKKSTDFFDQVHQVVRLIPKGKVTTYGAIAKYLGSSRSSRMVGYAMNASHTSIVFVPAHRVVNRAGMLTGKHFFSHPNEMEDLLLVEGIKVENNQIIDFEKHFWNPMESLDF